MDGYVGELPKGMAGISKISVQTGTSHGGVVLADGSLAEVNVDFDTLKDLSKAARDEYGTGGAVQHGASTLPPNAFNKFPQVGTLEIHLATNFQNIIFDNSPDDFVQTAYDYIKANHSDEWKENMTEDQFIYKSRKRAIGAMKADMWGFGAEVQTSLGKVLQEQFEFLFMQLNVCNTAAAARRWTTVVNIHKPRPEEAVEMDEMDLAHDLAD